MKPSVAIFMPVLNEIEALRIILPRIKREWCEELIVVDGGSTDGTIEFLQSHGITPLRQAHPGVADSYREGFLSSSSDYFITFQPDGNCIPELIPDLVKHLNGEIDVVYVSRFLPPAKSLDDTWVTAFGNRMFTWIISVLFGRRFTDSLGGFRAYKREAIVRMALHEQRYENWLRKKFDLMNSWEVSGCIRAAKLRLNCIEIPGDEPERIGGHSKMRVLRNGSFVVLAILYELFTGRRYLK